jgi:hypothetical protein
MAIVMNGGGSNGDGNGGGTKAMSDGSGSAMDGGTAVQSNGNGRQLRELCLTRPCQQALPSCLALVKMM